MRRRSGFTLTELLVVIAILLLLSTLAFAVFGTGKSSDKMRSGARSAQSALLGAKDRALHARDLRGVRLTFDQTNFNLVNGFVYLQPLPIQSAGFVSTVNPQDFSINYVGNAATQIMVVTQNGNGPTEWQSILAQDTNGIWPSTTLQIRIPSSQVSSGGQWYQLQRQSTSPPYWWIVDPNNNNQALLFLQTGFQGGTPSPGPAINFVGDSQASCDIRLGNDVLPFHQPITLPSGCVIDLAYSQIPPTWYNQQSVLPNNIPPNYIKSGNDPNTAGNIIVRQYFPPFDIMFSPRGNVTGSVSALGAIFFCIRDMRDATNLLNPADLSYNMPASPNFGNAALIPQGESLILAVYPQTGLVQTYELDLTDSNGDGFADNIFNLAQRGMSAGH